jgi:hypothetical protein
VDALSDCGIAASGSIEAGYSGFDRREVVAKRAKGGEPPQGNGLKRLENMFAEAKKPIGFAPYVRDNFERFHHLLMSVGRRADKWDIIAEWAKTEKITGDKLIKPDAARRAYERVRAEKFPKKAKIQPPKAVRESKPPPVTLLAAEGASTPNPGPPHAMDSLAASLGGPSTSVPPRRQFGLAKLKRNKDE